MATVKRGRPTKGQVEAADALLTTLVALLDAQNERSDGAFARSVRVAHAVCDQVDRYRARLPKAVRK